MQTTVEDTRVSTNLVELQRLFEEHHQRVFRAAYRVTGNVPDAEDVLQTVFLRLLRGGHELQRFEDAANYLYRAGVNAAVDQLRSSRNRSEAPLEEARSASAGGAHPQISELRRMLRNAIALLHPTAAEMFVLRYFEGYDNREVAQIMNTSESTVAVTLHRTRARLQKQLAHVR